MSTPFRVTQGGFNNLPRMSTDEFPGTEGSIGDVYENPDGSPMCAGFFELKHTDAPLVYTYDYDEMKIVVEGEFLLVDKATGQEEKAGPKDVLFFPKGSTIEFSTPDYALAYYVGYRDASLL